MAKECVLGLVTVIHKPLDLDKGHLTKIKGVQMFEQFQRNGTTHEERKGGVGGGKR